MKHLVLQTIDNIEELTNVEQYYKEDLSYFDYVSNNAPLFDVKPDDSELTVYEYLSNYIIDENYNMDTNLLLEERHDYITKLLDILSNKEKDVINKRFGLTGIDVMGLKNSVSLNRSLTKLQKEANKFENLREYVEI